MVRQVITFHYTLTDKKGKTIDSSRSGDPMSFLEGAGQIIPGLETVLSGLKAGEKKVADIPYQQAYGAYDQKLIYQVDRKKFPAQEIKVGDVFRVGNEQSHQIVSVIDANDKMVTLDANHPLAGQDLTFDVELVSKREATPQEVAHGHSHDHGHDH